VLRKKRTAAKSNVKQAGVCGLFCPACTVYIASMEEPARLEILAQMSDLPVEKMKCYGCHSENPIFLAENCKMVQCAASKGIDFCFECDEYPCEHLKKFQAEFPHRIELWSSQERIKQVGYKKWFDEMVDHYSCPQCGTINSAYDVECRKCGSAPSCKYISLHKKEIMEHLNKVK
jgi:ribosomal protein L40E